MADMVMYNGRAVPRNGFRAFVFDINLNKRLVNSYDEYEDLVSSGIWFSNKEIAEKIKAQKKKKKGDE